MNAIFTRKSVRKYTKSKVSDELVETLLRAAMQAPSAVNQQPWEFIVIRNRDVMEEITTFHPYSKMLLEADVAIVVCGNTSKALYRDYWVQDCSAACENILIEAEHLKLGAVWLGVYPSQERIEGLSTLLQLPQDVIPLSIIPIGYPDETRADSDRFQQDRVHYDHW